MQQDNWCNAHQGAVTGAFGTAVIPGCDATLAIVQELAHGLADAEDRSRREPGGEIVRVQPATLEQALECPERELAVVRGESCAIARSVAIRQIVADFTVDFRTLL